MAADREPAVRVAVRVERGHDVLAGLRVRDVLVVLAALVLHHLALVVELLLRDRAEQPAHAVRLEPQRGLELVGRQRLEVVGAVAVRGAVQRAARAAHQLEVPVVGDVRAALEHEVLEQVREPGAPQLLARAADVIVDVDRDDRIAVVLVDDHLEPVVEHELLERDLHHLGARRGGHREQGSGEGKCGENGERTVARRHGRQPLPKDGRRGRRAAAAASRARPARQGAAA